MSASSLLLGSTHDGLQALDLSRHLGGMAELIELCFNVRLEQGGYGFIREMRALSHAGPLLKIFDWLPPGFNPYWNLGYVWLAQGRVVGCICTQRAPGATGRWLIANVAVHPDHRRQGLALAMMRATLDLIRARGGTDAMLQVDDDNAGAITLYQQLGFRPLGAHTHWRRPTHFDEPPAAPTALHLRPRASGEWAAQYALAQATRPHGLRWNQPLTAQDFRPHWQLAFNDFFEGRTTEHWVVADPAAPTELAAALHIEVNSFEHDRLTLLVAPRFAGQVELPVLSRGLQLLGRRPWATVLDHPAADEATTAALRALNFQPGRVLCWMAATL